MSVLSEPIVIECEPPIIVSESYIQGGGRVSKIEVVEIDTVANPYSFQVTDLDKRLKPDWVLGAPAAHEATPDNVLDDIRTELTK